MSSVTCCGIHLRATYLKVNTPVASSLRSHTCDIHIVRSAAVTLCSDWLQILDAIDEPHFERLELPESCPKAYYNIMIKCWQHDPKQRPTFTDLLPALSQVRLT